MQKTGYFVLLGSVSTTVFLACSAPSKDNPDGGGGSSGGGAGGSTQGTGGGAGTSGSGGASGGSAGNSGSAGVDGGGTGGEDAGPGGAGGTGGTAGVGGTGGAGGGANSCSTAVLFAGNPQFNGDYHDIVPAGQALKDPTHAPLRFRNIAVIGNRFIAETQFEIWSADMTANPPMLKRFAGNEPVTDSVDDRFEAGLPCAQTQFMVIEGMAATPDGKLVISDFNGGAVIEITDPGGPNCQSRYVAGTHAKFLSSDIDSQQVTANPGDVDGKGSDAKFHGLGRVAVDPNNNIFLFDEFNAKIRMIANDANRTVTTVAKMPSADKVLALAYSNGKVYGVGSDGTRDKMWAFADPPAPFNAATPTANVTNIFAENGHFSEVPPSQQVVLKSLISDGQALIMASKGYVWRVAPDGTVLATLGGNGTYFGSFPTTFDLTMPHAAADWPLSTNGPGHDIWLALSSGKLYWGGGSGVGKYVVQFSCP